MIQNENNLFQGVGLFKQLQICGKQKFFCLIYCIQFEIIIGIREFSILNFGCDGDIFGWGCILFY